VNSGRLPDLSKRLLSAGVGVLALLMLGGIAPAPAAGTTSTVVKHIQGLTGTGKKLEQHLTHDPDQVLSEGGLALLNIADRSTQLVSAVNQGIQGKVQGPKKLSQGEASDPFATEDFISRLLGMTQSETSAAWCDRNALIGFNDSGSFSASLFASPSPSGSFSFEGWSRSTDAGSSYTDMGPVFADPLPSGVMFRDLFGDPVLGCTSASTFYYTSLAADTAPSFTSFTSGIAVSRSTDGGASFSRTVMAANKDADTHFLDKPWMAVDPGPTSSAGDDIIHVTYTDFDFSFSNPSCPGAVRTAIEYVRSTDGGATWSAPLAIETVCGDTPFLQGSHVAVGLGGNVYVAWEHFADFETRDIRIARSGNGGTSFGTTTTITSVTPVGDSFELQGDFRAFLDLQGLVVDRSSGASRGNVYITWHDGRNRFKLDPAGFCGGAPRYCFGDALFARSTNGGGSWSSPVRINDDPITLGTDQWFPAIDVDRSGNVWVTFYDRRRDSRNFLIDTFVAKSTTAGATWTNSRATAQSFAPVTGWEDFLVNPSYMGDYIAVTADALGSSPGVIVAWGDNSRGDANVLQRRF
jgi:hypothetical protein